MKLAILLFFIFVVSMSARAQSPWYYGAGKAVNLENAIQYKNGVQNITGATDPTSVAVNAPAGSLYLRTNGSLYVKQDAGSTTNWFPMSSGAITALTGDVTATGPGSVVATIANLAVTNAKIANSTIDLTAKVTGVLPVTNGGTGANSFTANYVLLGNGTSAFQTVNPGSDGNVLTASGGTWISAAPVADGITSLNGLTAAVQLFANGSTGLAPNWDSTTATHTLHIPLASGAGVTSGTISKTSYDAFVAKVDGPASSVDGEIALFDSTTGKLLKRATGSGYVKATSGVYSTVADVDAANDLTGVAPVANGGTGASTLTANNVILGNGTSAVQFVAPGSSGNVLTSDGTTWASSAPASRAVATIKDVKASGTAGGAATTGSYQTRVLSTLDDPFSIVTSLSSNQFVLPAGSYFIFASVPFYRTAQAKSRLRNVTDGSDAILGSAVHTDATNGLAVVHSIIAGYVTIAGSKTFQVEYRATTNTGAADLGVASSFTEQEVYTQVYIWRL